VALVSDESALEACLRRCAIQFGDFYLFLPLSVIEACCYVTELFAPRFCKLPCGGVGVDMDTVWCEDDTVLASRLVCKFYVELH